MTSDADVDMVQVTARLQVRDIKVRRLVQALRDLVSKVDRCHFSDVSLSAVSSAETAR
jgi:hypothetical protein